MTEARDVIVIGSGHNGLVAAAYLARAGLSVEVIERNLVAGGAVASEALTEPGFVHDTFSSWHPLFKLSAAHAELGPELEAYGLSYCETPEETTAHVLPDGRVSIAYREVASRSSRRSAPSRTGRSRGRARRTPRRSWPSASCSAPSCTPARRPG